MTEQNRRFLLEPLGLSYDDVVLAAIVATKPAHKGNKILDRQTGKYLTSKEILAALDSATPAPVAAPAPQNLGFAFEGYSEVFVSVMEDLVNPEIRDRAYNGYMKSRADIAWNGSKSGKAALDNTHKRQLGMGAFSTVKADPSDPHMVKKHNHHPIKRNGWQDGFNLFIEYLIVNDKLGNPHFPRIYNIEVVEDRDEKSIHTYKMERLVPLAEVSAEETQAYIENHMGVDWKEFAERYEYGGSEGLTDNVMADVIADITGRCLLNVYHTTNETLEEAFNVVRACKRGLPSDYAIDMHQGNLMWRRGSHGLTLVLTDPIA
jgi:hypothetical protein